MQEFSKDDFLKDLNWRYATKKFDNTKKVSDGDMKFLLETLRLSPSSFGLQPWKFIIVQNQDLRQKLMAASWNQTQVVDCSHFIVFTSLCHMSPKHVDRFMQRIQEVRKIPSESLDGYRQVIIGHLQQKDSQSLHHWTQRQSYIALANFMNAAALLHVDTCPMEGIDPHQYDIILGLEKTEYRTVAALAVGYRHAEDAYQRFPKVRYNMEDILEWRN